MATLQLSSGIVSELRLGQFTLVIEPEQSFGQSEPHVYVRFSIGRTENGEFNKVCFKEIRLAAQELFAFLASFQDLEARFFQFFIDRGDFAGTVE